MLDVRNTNKCVCHTHELWFIGRELTVHDKYKEDVLVNMDGKTFIVSDQKNLDNLLIKILDKTGTIHSF